MDQLLHQLVHLFLSHHDRTLQLPEDQMQSNKYWLSSEQIYGLDFEKVYRNLHMVRLVRTENTNGEVEFTKRENVTG